MATRSSNKDLADGIEVALDASETASKVTKEYNSVKDQFEVVNIQAKRIYQSVSIIFGSAILAAIISIAAGLLVYYKALGTLQTNSNMAIESLAIFTENVSSLDKSIKTVETNTENQELIKRSLEDIRSAAKKASDDISNAEKKYNQAIKISIQDTERVVRDFADTTLIDIKSQADATQLVLSDQIREIQKFFEPEVVDGEIEVDPESNIVTFGQFKELEVKVDQVIALQKELAAQLMEMTRAQKVAAVQRQKQAAQKKQVKPKVNPLKYP